MVCRRVKRGACRARGGHGTHADWRDGARVPRVQPAVVADGQLIRTLTPELVDETCTSSASPEITASPKPAGMPASSAPWTMAAMPCPLGPVLVPGSADVLV